MSIYVLVHGGNMSTDSWNELAKSSVYPPGGKLGGKVWDTIIPALKARHNRVFAPTLADEHESTLSGHIEQISAIFTENNLQDAVLVAHSYGGMVITGVAARLPERISRLVYVDAAFPDPGQSLFDIIVSAGCDTTAFVGLEPDMPYVEKLQFDVQKVNALPKTYILCTQSDFAAVTRVVKQKILHAGKNWTCIDLPASHVPMATMPDAFAQLLLDTGQ